MAKVHPALTWQHYFQVLYSSSKQVLFKQGLFFPPLPPPGDIWHYLGIFLLVTTVGKGGWQSLSGT